MTRTVAPELKLQGLLINYKKHLKYLIPIFFLILFVALKLFMVKGKAETDYLSAKVAFEKWQQGKSFDNALLRNLRTLIRKYPELSTKYDKAILQQMIAAGDKKLIEPLLEKSTLGPEALSTFYEQFSHISLLIAQENYDAAFAASGRLKTEMENATDFWVDTAKKYRGSTLFAFNLMRRAMLCQKLGLGDEEISAWKEFKMYAGWGVSQDIDCIAPVNRDAFSQLYNHFAHHKVSLDDYIKYREISLK
ncbi:MAG: hypothetical protein P0S94_04915 [Simkaniaceae bacterium]|nr:hypothetical protein [Simkaniaceae bacterium]